ncbi:MAG TPA: hypothetical protein DIU15_15755 [Deltaproteobacteria bacterium]|nr:hypothetical protein [Deltaproteobacteria bacterium]HCP47496.1 hypothetical protein [Deltaproteobacteria bacterium]
MKRIGRPPKDANRAPTKERILEAAAEAFSQAGYASVGLDEIAKKVGLTRPSLLYHFGSKEELYRQVLLERILALGQALAEFSEGGDDVSQHIETLVGGFIRFLDENPEFAPLLLRDMMDGRGPSRELLGTTLVPLFDGVEAKVAAEDQGQLSPEVPLREALLQLASSALVYWASPSFRDQLWTRGDRTMELARLLLLRK